MALLVVLSLAVAQGSELNMAVAHSDMADYCSSSQHQPVGLHWSMVCGSGRELNTVVTRSYMAGHL